MNISNTNSTPAYQPPQPVQTRPKQRADNDGDTDDGGTRASSSASEASESGRLNVLA